MTENSAFSSFGSTSARPNAVRERVGGGPGLRRNLKSRNLGLNRGPIWRMSVNTLALRLCNAS